VYFKDSQTREQWRCAICSLGDAAGCSPEQASLISLVTLLTLLLSRKLD